VWIENHREDWIHEVREQISQETESLSAEEWVRYYEAAAAELLPNLRHVKNCMEPIKSAA